jgi:L-ascorbate metabolism protein UlaG (beta-lactamase superfamily)
LVHNADDDHTYHRDFPGPRGRELIGTGSTQATSTPGTASVQMQHIRNATTKIDYAGKTFLVDPFLAKKDTYPGFEGTFRSHLRNPTVELPMSVEDVLKGVDAVIVTHTHLDHWDGDKHQ